MTDSSAPPPGADEPPPPVRAALLAVAAEVLGTLPPGEVPQPLRQVQRFAPRRRASAGAQPLWSALVADAGFRGRVARVWSQGRPEIADRLVHPEGVVEPVEPVEPTDRVEPAGPTAPAASTEEAEQAEDPVELAVGAWLVRPDGWREVVEEVARGLVAGDERTGTGPATRATTERAARAEVEVARLTVRLGVALARAAAAQDEVTALTREQRRLRSDADRARSEARRTLAEATAARAEAERLRSEASADLERAATAQRTAEAERTAARGEIRVARDLATARARLLLDTIVDAGSALRNELALPPVSAHPADLVAPVAPVAAQRPTSRGRTAHDPALLDELLALPHAHLIVDGYNVSKSGFGHLTLAEQRHRLVEGLASALGHTGAEITCCFDGQEGPRPPGGYARGVRVLFSVGEIADDLIRRLVLAEPTGRVVVVVTSDQQVASDVQAAAAWAVPTATLLARLQRT